MKYILKISVALAIILLPLEYTAMAQEVSDEELLEIYDGLRVADVSDGMDMVGLPDVGLIDPKVEALWKDIDQFSHIFRGIAVTARYIPTNKVVETPKPKEEFKKWEGDWYTRISPETFLDSLKQGTALVIDARGDGDTGSMGSFNGLLWQSKGVQGVVTNGAVRDTDEIIKQQIPVYLDHENRGRGIRPGRNELESVNQTVVIGGVQINAGDVVVADGDGVVVVPRKHAVQVAEYAREILQSDKEARRNLYKELDIPLDETVKIDSTADKRE